MEMFLIFLLGLLIGLLITWYFLEGRYRQRVEEVQKSWEGKVKHLETEVKQADVAHEETKTLLRQTEAEHKGCSARLSEYEARLRDAHAALERSAETEASMRKSLDTLRQTANLCRHRNSPPYRGRSRVQNGSFSSYTVTAPGKGLIFV